LCVVGAQTDISPGANQSPQRPGAGDKASRRLCLATVRMEIQPVLVAILSRLPTQSASARGIARTEVRLRLRTGSDPGRRLDSIVNDFKNICGRTRWARPVVADDNPHSPNENSISIATRTGCG
jgi:hypothetical protein